MFEQVKAHLFTVTGVLITVIHLFVAVGFVTTWVLFQTQVMGADPLEAIQQTKGAKR